MNLIETKKILGPICDFSTKTWTKGVF